MVRTQDFRSCSKIIGISFAASSLRAERSNPQATGRLDSSSQALLAMTYPLSVPSAKPECVLHDAQPHFTAQRHQRFRVELHAADRQRLVLDRHGDAIVGTSGYHKRIGDVV